MRLEQFFAPDSWAADNASDRDMSTAPALLPDGQVVLAGKSRIVYLLNGPRTSAASAASRPSCPGLRRRHRRRRRRRGQHRLPALPQRGRRGPRGHVGARAAGAVDIRIGGRPAHRGRAAWSGRSAGAGRCTASTPPPGRCGSRRPSECRPTTSRRRVGDGLLLAPSASRVVAFRAGTGGAAASPSGSTAASPPASRPRAVRAPPAGQAEPAAACRPPPSAASRPRC